MAAVARTERTSVRMCRRMTTSLPRILHRHSSAAFDWRSRRPRSVRRDRLGRDSENCLPACGRYRAGGSAVAVTSRRTCHLSVFRSRAKSAGKKANRKSRIDAAVLGVHRGNAFGGGREADYKSTFTIKICPLRDRPSILRPPALTTDRVLHAGWSGGVIVVLHMRASDPRSLTRSITSH